MLKQASVNTYYIAGGPISLEELHPYQCFIYGVVCSFTAATRQPLVVLIKSLPVVFFHTELTCLAALKNMQAKGLIDLEFKGESAIITPKIQNERAA